jgi:hypothetical protein
MEEKMRIWNWVQAKSINSAGIEKWRLTDRKNKNSDLKGYFSSDASLKAEV